MITGLRLKHVAKVEAGQSPPSQDVTPFDGDGTPFLQGNAEFGGLYPVPVHRCDSAPRIADAGTLLVSVRAPVGAINTADQRYGIGRGLAAVRPHSIHSRYVYWLLLSSAGWLNSIAMGSTFTAISGSDLGDVSVPVTNERVQLAIADYLDRETGQIDAFIAKNEELITLLTERRRATIGAAVTRGVRRDGPTTPRGVAWLVDVPSHWSVAGLARYARTVSGVGFPESEQGIADAEIAFYKVNSLGQADADGVIRKSWDTISRETAVSLRAKVLPPGTILLAKIGAALLLGRIRRTDRPACIDNNMMAIVPNEHLNARFASYALQMFDFKALANPGTIPSMDMHALMHRETAIPPLVEQEEIADYLDRRLAMIDAALATCRRGVRLAGERRAALISAAVAGKIDVGVAA